MGSNVQWMSVGPSHSGRRDQQAARHLNPLNDSDANEVEVPPSERGAFDHVRRREFGDPGYKTKDVDLAQRALMLRLAGYASFASLAGFLMGMAADSNSDSPVPWTLLLPVVFGLVAMGGGYMLMMGGGRVAASLHNPSGKSTPPTKQYSSAQALMATMRTLSRRTSTRSPRTPRTRRRSSRSLEYCETTWNGTKRPPTGSSAFRSTPTHVPAPLSWRFENSPRSTRTSWSSPRRRYPYWLESRKLGRTLKRESGRPGNSQS